MAMQATRKGVVKARWHAGISGCLLLGAAVCQPDAWLRIFHSFVYVEKKDVVDLKGNWSKETLIFPRFHQWSAVNEMIADAKKTAPAWSIWLITAPVPARPARFLDGA